MTYNEAIEKQSRLIEKYEKKELHFNEFTEVLRVLNVRLCFVKEGEKSLIINERHIFNEEELKRTDFDVVVRYEYSNINVLLSDQFEKDFKLV